MMFQKDVSFEKKTYEKMSLFLEHHLLSIVK